MAAWSMGWSEAQQTSGTHWQAPFLAQLLDDPYPAVRLFARRTLRTLPGFHDLRADLLGNKSERTAAAASVVKRWRSEPHAENPAIFVQDSDLQFDRIKRLLSQRDETRIDLAE
jgi:hypothetical protein